MAAPASKDPVSSQVSALKTPPTGRRRLSWLLFALLLALALILPVASSLWQERPAGDGAQPAPTGGGLDSWWSPGPISASHHRWAEDCRACHSEPFKPVQDKDCQTCHADTKGHTEMHASSQTAVADLRCASCHREHQGEFGLLEQNRHFVGEQCASCHADITAVAPQSQLGPVSDFGRDHPAFRVQLNTSEGLKRETPPPGQVLLEKTTFKFSHAAHLKTGGIKGPQGKVEMQCSDCHQPTAEGQRFEPVSMEQQCQSCHRLDFDPAFPDRQVPHGNVDAVLSTLMEFYSFKHQQPEASPAAPTAINALRPGHTQNAPTLSASTAKAADLAHADASAAAKRLFEESACVVCHTVTPVAGAGQPGTPGSALPQWQVEPPPASHPWLPAARFDHSAHQSMDCTSCHAAPASEQAADVLIPAIDTCRSCHAGTDAGTQQVPSDCGLCHDFHQSMRASLQRNFQQQFQQQHFQQQQQPHCPNGSDTCAR